MYRFTMETDVMKDTNERQLATAGITRDENFAQRLRDTGTFDEDETIDRLENEAPGSTEGAVEYAHIFIHAPTRVWLNVEVHMVTDEVLARIEKPTA